jgi:hypothetical protein
MQRYLVFVGLGAMGLLGQFFASSLRARFWRGAAARRICEGALVGLLAGIHLILSPVAFAILASHSPAPQAWLANLHTLPKQLSSSRDLIFVNHPIPMDALDWFTARAVDREPLPRCAQILAPATSPIRISRIDERSLLVRPEKGYFSTLVSRLGYSGEFLPAAGSSIPLPMMQITITERGSDGRPAAVLFHFDVPLEDASLEWVCWEDGAFREFRPPAVGKTVWIAASGLPF